MRPSVLSKLNRHEILEPKMRSFVTACFVVIVIALAAAAILDKAVQKSATGAFSTSAVRL
jgi:hypothetical protein